MGLDFNNKVYDMNIIIGNNKLFGMNYEDYMDRVDEENFDFGNHCLISQGVLSMLLY